MTASGKPITPAEAKTARATPPEVFKVFNDFIKQNLRISNGKSCATVHQNAVVVRIADAMECTREYLFDIGWLDVEKEYEKHGWKVRYDKPGYNETYEAYFVFTEK